MSGKENFYRKHVELPKENDVDKVGQMALNLTPALLKLQGKEGQWPGRQVGALKRLSMVCVFHAHYKCD